MLNHLLIMKIIKNSFKYNKNRYNNLNIYMFNDQIMNIKIIILIKFVMMI